MDKPERVPDWTEVIDAKNKLIAELKRALEPFVEAEKCFRDWPIKDPNNWYAYAGVKDADGTKGSISVMDLRRAAAAYEAEDLFPPKEQKLSDFDTALLFEVAGEDPGRKLHWGAAMGVSIEHLHSNGYVDRVYKNGCMTYEIAPRGAEYLKNLKEAK